eukprot:7061471-Alexandrium_andersonii.AAC.1
MCDDGQKLLVDSGSDFNVCPKDIGESWGSTHSSQRMVDVQGNPLAHYGARQIPGVMGDEENSQTAQ